MKEKQVIVQWYDTEAYPEKEGVYICTCDVDLDDVSFRSVFIICYWSEDSGWITPPEDVKLEITAWCDLKPY